MKHVHLIALAAVVAAGTSCGSAVRQGRSPVYLVVDTMTGQRGGAAAGPPVSGVLQSDVITNVIAPAPCSPDAPCPSVFADTGSATLSTSLKDIGTPTSPTAQTANNAVTITQYHVEYVRSDGRNTPGVDVPYAFDGATSGTIPPGGTAVFGFELVRNIAKQQAPLIQLGGSSTILSTIANVTFYGHDQAGNQVTVTGSITIEFGNFADLQ